MSGLDDFYEKEIEKFAHSKGKSKDDLLKEIKMKNDAVLEDSFSLCQDMILKLENKFSNDLSSLSLCLYKFSSHLLALQMTIYMNVVLDISEDRSQEFANDLINKHFKEFNDSTFHLFKELALKQKEMVENGELKGRKPN